MLYSDSQIKSLTKKSRVFALISSIVLGISLLGLGLSLIWMSDDTITLIQIIFAIELNLAAFFFVYAMSSIVAPNKRRIKLTKSILESEEKVYECEVVNVGKLRTVKHNIKVYDVEVISNKQKYTFLFDSEFEQEIEKLTGSVSLKVRNKYIVEVNNYEKDN